MEAAELFEKRNRIFLGQTNKLKGQQEVNIEEKETMRLAASKHQRKNTTNKQGGWRQLLAVVLILL